MLENIFSFIESPGLIAGINNIISVVTNQFYIFINLMQFVCVLLIMFYILFQTGFLKKIEKNDSFRVAIKEEIILIVLFGILGIAATYLGVPTVPGSMSSPLANVRNLAPMIAGMLGGLWAGIGAGLIGGVYCYSQLTGIESSTALPYMIDTILAGLIGGLIFIFIKKKFPKPIFAALIIVIFEVIDMVIIYYLGRYTSPAEAWSTVSALFIPVGVADTFGMFIFSFMVNRALNYQNIKAAKDMIEGEMQAASRIQTSMLPRIFPPFPDRNEIDIFAVMNPAKNVGGDFYDFFFIDNNRLWFIIGDVSDKGVPAALFMTIIKTLLKTEALRGEEPATVLKRVNDILYPDNESCSFATVFCGILDVTSGEVEYSNGGHLPPIIVSDFKEIKTVKIDTNFMVGNIKEATFTTQKLKLFKNDMIFLYTDGVTETETENGKMFTGKGLRSSLTRCCTIDIPTSDIVKLILADLKEFRGTAPQYDDTTIMSIKLLS